MMIVVDFKFALLELRGDRRGLGSVGDRHRPMLGLRAVFGETASLAFIREHKL